ncbi:IS66 family insertion sequence element accessory protein TnpB [Sphingobium sp. HWE2-09]|uniref:IS66 family insertion sequence element accessory protein TnpB n=1 Tax=Sphingobium sp. HWE2-09 TaxID=3108390 RepID=UPI002DCF949A|nr:IS66 family insertion sequence element accessory protein TnpB [Sphingobium sp. HWE2-09]
MDRDRTYRYEEGHAIPGPAQQSFRRDPHAGDLYVFRGRRGDLCKILWHDGIGMSLYAKALLSLSKGA